MKKNTEHKVEWVGKIEGKEFSNILFDELAIRNADIRNVMFRKIHFKNSYLGFDTNYTDCTFIDCKFYGKYSSLGRPAKFTDCRFENCKFIGIDLFTGQHFYNCVLSGLMKNPILSDKNPNIDNNETYFKDCDLANMLFDNVSIYGKNIFDNCILPKFGIRLFDNTDDKLIQHAEDICSKIDSVDKINSVILFRKDTKQGQNPIVFDNLFLDSFFKTENSKKIFDEIIKGYELNK